MVNFNLVKYQYLNFFKLYPIWDNGTSVDTSSAIADLKGQWPFLRFLAVLDSKNATIGGLISHL